MSSKNKLILEIVVFVITYIASMVSLAAYLSPKSLYYMQTGSLAVFVASLIVAMALAYPLIKWWRAPESEPDGCFVSRLDENKASL